MAHGSKRWITDATGKVKKSKDRTKKDYYAAVEYWDEYTPYRRYTWMRGESNGDFCPQCKGIAKEYEAERKATKANYDAATEHYDRLYGVANKAWDEYKKAVRSRRWCKSMSDAEWERCYAYEFPNGLKKPKMDEPISFYRWIEHTKWDGQYDNWHYHWRNTLCHKHEAWEEAQRENWHNRLGWKENYWYGVLQSRRDYRKAVKNVMQRAKYIEDYEGYDDILPRRREWID